MARYECSVCGFVYDEEQERTRWSDLPDDWTCPICGSEKTEFEPATDDALPAADDALPAAEEALPAADDALPAASKARPTGGLVSGRAIVAHRVFGYVFLTVYLVLIFQMIPRLWTYQIEFPARTVVHIALGMAVGTLLVLKIVIVRFFRRLEVSLVPALGTSLLVGSVVLIGIAVPTAFREAFAMSALLTETDLNRVRTLLVEAGLSEAESQRLASPSALRAGQQVLRHECIGCHDLRTVLARPRTPQNWVDTVRRMAGRTTPLNPLDEEEQRQVTAYLVAISPQLQQSAQQLGRQQRQRDEARRAAEAVTTERTLPAAYDPAAAKRLFERKCSQCHKPNLVEQARPSSEAKVRELIAKMVGQGLTATEEELAQIIRYVTETYAQKSTP